MFVLVGKVVDLSVREFFFCFEIFSKILIKFVVFYFFVKYDFYVFFEVF